MKPMRSILILLCGVMLFAAIMIAQRRREPSNDRTAREWNEQQSKLACTAKEDMPALVAHKGDHIVCDNSVSGDYQRRPPAIPEGYRTVFYTSGCPTCAVGWTLKKGTECEARDLNCAD